MKTGFEFINDKVKNIKVIPKKYWCVSDNKTGNYFMYMDSLVIIRYLLVP